MNAFVPGSTPAADGGDIQIAQASDEPIGKVETVEGTVIVKHADGTEAPLHGGDPVFQGDELRTGPEGAVGIVFIDDSTFSLAEDARMSLDELIYDPSAQQGVLKASLVQGVFSFISGEIAKTAPDAMTITTPMAVIGIRGTTGAINLPPNEPLTVVLTADAGGTVGEITVFNEAGVQVLSVPFQATQVAGAGAAPSVTFTMTAEEFNDSFGRALAFLPPSPAAGDGEDEGEGDGEGEGEDAGDGDGEGEDGEGDGDGEDSGAEEFADDFGQTLQDFITGASEDLLAGGTGTDQSALDALTQQIKDLVSQYLSNDFLDSYDPFTGGDDDDDNGLVQTFEETLYGTSGDDTLSGSDLDTDFRMEQAGTGLPSGTLGGTDTVDGGGGTDQITFDNLQQVIGYFDASNSELYFWDWSQYGDSDPDDPATVYAEETAAQATISFTDMEQLYFGSYDGSAEAQFGGDFTFSGNFTGMIVAGGSDDDTINSGGDWFSGADAVLIFGGGGNDTIYGSSVYDDIQGGDGNDTIYGGGGTNSLSGGAGNDTFYAEGVLNTISGGDGDDTVYIQNDGTENNITGGSGTDTVDYSALETSLTVSLSSSEIGVLHESSSDTISGVETLIGSVVNDTFSFTGNASGSGVTTVNGGDGNDTFTFTTGATFSGLIDGGDGSDTLVLTSAGSVTAANVETITGSAYDDTIVIQGTSDVTVTGGAGSDTLTLDGSGSHTVRFTSTDDLGDIINGFASASDSLLFDSGVFTGDGSTLFSSGYLDNASYFDSGSGMVASSGASVYFFQDTDTGNLYYDADGSDGAAEAVLVGTFDSDLSASDFTGTSGAV